MNSVATFAWLDRYGLERDALKYVEIPASAFLAAVEQNRVSASTIYEPYFSADVATGKVRVLGYPFDPIGRHFSDALIFTRKDWAAEHKDVVEKFLRASEEASTDIAGHEDVASQLTAEFGGLDPATMP